MFNYDDYIDLKNYILQIDFPDNSKQKMDSYRINVLNYSEIKELFPTEYELWQKAVMGGEKNVFLRELLKGKKLA